jgi:hypothetical protein
MRVRVQRVAGFVLAFAGVALVAIFQFGMPAAIAPALAGAGLLGVFAVTRVYGYLVPGGVLTGLGIGLMAESAQNIGGAVTIGIGAGFVFVTVTDHLAAGGRSGRWWPLVPGGLLLAIGAAQNAVSRAQGESVFRWWPALLVVVGVWMLARQRRQRKRRIMRLRRALR